MFNPKDVLDKVIQAENLKDAYKTASFFIHAHSGTVVRRGAFDLMTIEPINGKYHLKIYVLDSADTPANELARVTFFYPKVTEARNALKIIKKGELNTIIKDAEDKTTELKASEIGKVTAYQVLYSEKKKKIQLGEHSDIWSHP